MFTTWVWDKFWFILRHCVCVATRVVFCGILCVEKLIGWGSAMLSCVYLNNFMR